MIPLQIVNLVGKLAYFLSDFRNYILVNALFSSIFFLSIIATKKQQITLRKITVACTFFVFIFFFIFSLFEIYYRYKYDQSDGLNFLKVNRKWQERHVIYNADIYRDKQFDLKKENGEIRIGAIGDSFTFGAGIENYKDRYSNILEDKFLSEGKKIKVYNFGKSGYDLEQEIRSYDNIKNFNNDIIIWEYYLNDIQPEDQLGSARIFESNNQKNKLLFKIANHSYFLDFLYFRVFNSHTKTYKNLNDYYISLYNDNFVFENHKKRIKDFMDILKNDNKRVVVIIFPIISLVGPNYPATNIHKSLDEIFKSNDAEVVDLLDDLRSKDPTTLMASKFDSHPNEYVHTIAAQKLHDTIQNLLK